ncbi:Protein CYP-14A3 [Aphelenchoides avenae]|nr:Protein CYP-14A3 [Aphelenchus avenae]
MFLLLAVVLLAVYVAWYYRDVARYPKGPTPLPFVGNLLQLPRANLHLYIHEKSKKYGSVYTIFTPLPVVVLTDYAALKEALLVKGDHFAGRVHRPPQCFFSNIPRGGIIANDGDSWRDQRRMALTIMRNFGMGRNIMEEKIMLSVAGMCEYLDRLEDKSSVNMMFPLLLCVGNVINELLFGYRYRHDNTEKFMEFVHILTDFFQCFKTTEMLMIEAWPWARHLPIVSTKYKNMKGNMAVYFDFITKEVEALKESFDPAEPATNFVHAYMKEIDENNNAQKANFSREQLVVVASDFWVAGMETTSTTLRWAVMYMLQWPDIQAKVQAEIDRVVGRDRFPALADKPNLPYTNAVLHEIQRYGNIVSAVVSHRCTSDQTVKGLPVPANTAVYPQFFSILKDDPVFEDPNQFKPERFLKEDGVTFRKELLDRMVQFGMGKRQCAGESLSRMELFLIFTTIMQRYRFVANGQLDLTPIYGLVMPPHDHSCRLIPRI